MTEMLALGQVTGIRVPTWEQEDLRDLSRLRATAAKNPAHARQQVNAILLRHGRHRDRGNSPAGARPWRRPYSTANTCKGNE